MAVSVDVGTGECPEPLSRIWARLSAIAAVIRSKSSSRAKRWTPSSVSLKITSLDEALTYSLTDAAFISGGLFVITGTGKWFNPNKGFGFIQPDDGTEDNFVHISAVERSGLTTLNEGQKVEYELVEDQRGRRSADNLKLVQ